MFARLGSLISDPLLPAAWHRLRRLWRPMAAWTFLLWAVVVVLLVPLSSAVAGSRLGTSQRVVIGNEELLAWLLTPAGLTYLLLAAGVVAANWVLRYAGLYQMIVDDLEGRPPGLARTVRRLAMQLPTLLRFSVKSAALGLLALAPVVTGGWLIYRVFLWEHDINYYISARPVEWYRALGALAAWLTLSAGILAWVVGRCVLALPAWLDGHRGFVRALRRSWALTRARAGRLLRMLALSAAAWVSASLLVEAVFFAIAARITEWVSATSSALWPAVACTGGYLAGSALLNVATGFVGFSYLSVVLTKFYLEDTPLHRTAPPSAARAELTPDELRALRTWLNPRRVVLGVALLLAISVFAGGRFLAGLPEPRPVVVTAHRGGPAPAPENTLAALERAIAAGADFAEIDVLRTRDGVVVAAHDADLMRLARVPRRIAESTYAELSGVVMLPDDGSPPGERRVATLGDFLERARGRIGLNIELKYYRWDPALAPAVIGEIRRRQMATQVVLMSLNFDAVRQVRQVAPEIKVGYVSALAVGNINRLPVDFVAVNQRRITPQLLRDAHRHRRQVHAWTVNTVAAMADLMELGVDGIITDHPGRAVRVRAELAELSPVERLLLRFRKVLVDTGPN